MTSNIDHIRAIEFSIVSTAIDSILAASDETTEYKISVYDGEEYQLRKSINKFAILSAMFSTGQDVLVVWGFDKSNAAAPRKRLFTVTFIYGNGCDVISDYSDNDAANRMLKPAMDLAERYSNDKVA